MAWTVETLNETVKEQRVVILRALVKKTEKTPQASRRRSWRGA
jgi:phage-related protein